MQSNRNEQFSARLKWFGLAALLLIIGLAPWLRNRGYVRSFFDYGVVMGGVGRIESGQKPYVDFITPIQTGWYYLNWLAEKAAGGTFQAMTWSAAVSIAMAALVLFWMLSRRWPVVSSAVVAGSLVCATVSQHTIFWYNPWGVVLMGVVAWAGAIAPVFRRDDLVWHVLIGAALFLGGVNKINMQLLALAVAWGWALRAGLTGRAGWGRVCATLLLYFISGLVLPICAEMALTGASFGTWWHNVVALPAAARTGTVLAAVSWAFLIRPLHDYYGSLLLPQVGLVGMILSILTLTAILRKTWNAPGQRERFIPLACGILAVVAGAVLLTTNMDIAYIGLAGWLALLIGLWLGYGMPSRGAWFYGVIVGPALLIGLVSWYSAWLGQRSQFGHSSAARADYVDGGEAGPAFAYFSGTRIPPEFGQSLEAIGQWRQSLSEKDRNRILYGPGSEWVAHIWPALLTRGLPIYVHAGNSMGKHEYDTFYADLRSGEYREILVSLVLDRWDQKLGSVLDDKYERSEFAGGTFFHYSRSPIEGVSGDPVDFFQFYGGSVDSRYLVTSTADPMETEDHRKFLGIREGSAEMRVIVPANRLQGEVIVRRIGKDLSEPLAADFAIYVEFSKDARQQRWSQRVELPAGQSEVTASYAIDGSHLTTAYTVQIPPEFSGKLAAGWRNPSITDVGGDSDQPQWFNRWKAKTVVLDEAALAKLLPGKWRPVQAQMRNGYITDQGIQLPPGGEIWMKVSGLVSKFTGVTTVVSEKGPIRLPVVRGFWYKAGRLQGYASPAPEKHTDRSAQFQAWCGEPGGWLVIVVDRTPDMSPVLVRITEVVEHTP